jgi:glycosyltransferase involved in cell wall biosynthesis
LQKAGLRILIYSDHFYPSLGGSENYALDLASELTRQGHSVGVVTAEKKSVADSFPFQIFRFRKPFSPHRINLNFLEIPWIVKQFRPDILQINYQTGGENLLIPLLKIMGIPFIITYHADHVVTLGRMIDEMQLVSTFRCANMIMVQSERDKTKFKMRGIPEERLRLIRFNGIDTEKYKCVSRGAFDNDRMKLLCIARLDDSHKYKGVQKLIQSLREYRDHELSSKLSLTIIGDGNLRKFYEDECKTSKLNNVKFRGDVNFKDLLGQLCDVNFLILPSINKAEGFGRVALEALSCGTPVIVSKYAGIAELIRKYNAGIVYDPGDFKGLIVALTPFLCRLEELQQLAENGKRLISEEQLSLSSTIKKTTHVYHKSLENK